MGIARECSDELKQLSPKLTIVVPVYNERKTVLSILEELIRLPVLKEIIVVDNCSTDGTKELLKEFAERWRPDSMTVRLEVVFQPTNMLKGTSVKLGIKKARGEYVIVQDADLEYDPKDIIRLLEHAERTNSVAVFGSRILGRRLMGGYNWLNIYEVGRRLLTLFFRLLYGAKITDVATCYKLMRSDVAKRLRLRSRGFELDFEIPAQLRLLGVKIDELPISYNPRGILEGKKLRPWDGIKALYVMLSCRFRDSQSLR
ncbi:MAG: hypothetical protein HZRFUVUK_000278 [Candidatus Fervidibacterota bacterium]|jgi:glycosyltransferase involved in cell wall biosynthesis